MKYTFNIDEKSLFRGVKNDFSKGQSPTVHTPLNQSKDENKRRKDIYEFINGYESENIQTLPEFLLDKCMPKTTSKADSKIVGFYIFSKFAVDGVSFDVDASFAMYVKEEISETIVQRSGVSAPNSHKGRQKLHYPISLIYDSYNINNTLVLDKIIEVNGGFAYVVNGFDFDTETKVLNFRTTMIGPEGVLLSNVFRRKKGVGLKLLVDGISLDQSTLVSSATRILSEDENSAFIATLEKIQKSSRINGMTGEEYVYDNIKRILGKEPERIDHISKKYPQSPYDIECVVNGEILYIEVKSTEKEKKSFYMSRGERTFMDKYDNHYLLILVTSVNSNHRRHFKYRRNDIMNESVMKQELQGIKFIVK